MGRPRLIHAGTAGRTALENLSRQHGTSKTISLVTDSYDFEKMLNYSMQCWYRAQPDGHTNYTNPKMPSQIDLNSRADICIGEVSISRENHPHQGKAGLLYTPSAFYYKKFGYLEKQIAIVDLRNNTFLTMWENKAIMGEDFWHIPTVLMNDTEVVLPLLGLKKKE